jgi:hypothetical protein
MLIPLAPTCTHRPPLHTLHLSLRIACQARSPAVPRTRC